MSAGALLVSDSEIHLMSDGIMTYRENGQWHVADRNTNKIKVVNEQCALLWLGVGLYELWDQVKQETEHLADPKQVAWKIKSIVEPFHRQHNIDISARVRITGFYHGMPKIYEVNSYEGDFTPLEEKFRPGMFYAWAMIHGTNNDNIYPSTASKYIKKGLPTEEVAKGAFREVVDYYQQQDVTIGGGTYHHCIRR